MVEAGVSSVYFLHHILKHQMYLHLMHPHLMIPKCKIRTIGTSANLTSYSSIHRRERKYKEEERKTYLRQTRFVMFGILHTCGKH
jgi:hypothetical protein